MEMLAEAEEADALWPMAEADDSRRPCSWQRVLVCMCLCIGLASASSRQNRARVRGLALAPPVSCLAMRVSCGGQ